MPWPEDLFKKKTPKPINTRVYYTPVDPPEPLECAKYACPSKITETDPEKYAKARKSWFCQKNGDNWCPDHIPTWVHAWRQKKGQ